MQYPDWMLTAEAEIGVKEVQGEADNPRVIWYHSFTDLGAQHDSVPWCSSFICAMLESNGYSSTRNALARSYLDYGSQIEPRYGAICIVKRGRHEWQGHVGFYVYQDEHYIYILGGNQKDAVNVRGFKKDILIDARWPILKSNLLN